MPWASGARALVGSASRDLVVRLLSPPARHDAHRERRPARRAVLVASPVCRGAAGGARALPGVWSARGAGGARHGPPGGVRRRGGTVAGGVVLPRLSRALARAHGRRGPLGLRAAMTVRAPKDEARPLRRLVLANGEELIVEIHERRVVFRY